MKFVLLLMIVILGLAIAWLGPMVLDTAQAFHRSGHSWWTIAGLGCLAAAAGTWTAIRSIRRARLHH